MLEIKKFLKDWAPPALIRIIKRYRVEGIQFEGSYSTWQTAAAQCTGYDAKSILEKVLEATLKVKCGEARFERDSVLFNEIQYSWPVTAALMWTAALNKGELNVLDFGGALGSSYFQNRAFLTNLPRVSWSVVEQAHYVDAGRSNIEDNILRFYHSMNECIAQNNPNVILLSSVIEYLPDYKKILTEIACYAKPDAIIIDRTPMSNNFSERICIQRVPSDIFEALLPCRIISINVLKDLLMDCGYCSVAQYPSLGRAGTDFTYQGLIFKKENQ